MAEIAGFRPRQASACSLPAGVCEWHAQPARLGGGHCLAQAAAACRLRAPAPRSARPRRFALAGTAFPTVLRLLAAGGSVAASGFPRRKDPLRGSIASARLRATQSTAETTAPRVPALPAIAPGVWKPIPVSEEEVSAAAPQLVTRKSDPEEVAALVWSGGSALFVDRYRDLLEVRKALNAIAKRCEEDEAEGGGLEEAPKAEAHRARRKERRAAARRLFIRADASNGELQLVGAPQLGYLPVFYSGQLVLRANDVSALLVAWQFFVNGVQYDFLDHPLHPFFGVYFTPTPVEHFNLLQDWLALRPTALADTRSRVLDLGTGCGVVSFIVNRLRPSAE
ncbi:unnamed protein product, partial [Polarella glacialis]